MVLLQKFGFKLKKNEFKVNPFNFKKNKKEKSRCWLFEI